MEKIRCPHCSAVNQDVTPEDNCWQCEKRLGDTSAAAGAADETAADGSSVRQVSQPSLEQRVAARKAARKQTNLTPYIVIALVIIVALIAYLVMKH